MKLNLTVIATRLMVDAGFIEQAMKPYKPKTASELKLKTDPAHRKEREAYKHRTSGDKMKDEKRRKEYYRRNKSQLQIRQKKSRMLHHKPATPKPAPKPAVKSAFTNDEFGIWCCSYRIVDGRRFSLNLFGTYEEALSHAANLELSVDSKLESIIPASMNGNYGLDNIGNDAAYYAPGYGARATTNDIGKFSDPSDKMLFS